MANNKYTIPAFIFIALLIIAGAYFGVFRSASIITPPTQVSLQSGQVYWVATISGDSIKDGVGFTFNPSSYTISNADVVSGNAGSLVAGETVKPSASTIVYFSNNGNYCTYTLQPASLSKLLVPTINYYNLGNPSRHIIVNVCNVADCKNLDATNIGGDILTFNANGGAMTVKGLGALVGSQNCPDASNVALLFDNNKAPHYLDRTQFISSYNSIYTFLDAYNLVNFLSTQQANTVYLNTFVSSPSINTQINQVTANMPGLTLGSGVVTLTADASFFKSAFIIPSTQASPKIDSIVIPNIKQGTSGTAIVKFHNTVSSSGVVNIQASATNSQIAPSTQSYTLTDNGAVSFVVTAPVSSGADSITVKICSTGQIGSSTCDSSSQSFNVLQSNPAQYCGDGVCTASIGETSTTCSADCPLAPVNPKPATALDCSAQSNWLIPSYPSTVSGSGFLGLFPYTTNTCVPDYTILAIIIGAIIVVGFGYYMYKNKRKK